MARKTKGKNRIETEVHAAYKKHGNGGQVDIMDLGKILQAGTDAGKQGQGIEAAVLAAIQHYRKN